MSQTFKEHGWQVTSIDCCAEYEPDIIADIGQLTADDMDHYDVVWSSPPCEQFSIANHFRAWTPDHKPRTQKTVDAVKLHRHALQLIHDMNPKIYFIENPRGLLRTMPWMKPYRLYQITYCRYGCPVQKPTDIWTNYPAPGFKKPCHAGDSCHISSPSGSNKGLSKRSNFKDAHDRAVIPQELCDHVEMISRRFMENPAPVMRQLSIGELTYAYEIP
jgi:hypothetical protein